MCCAVLPVIAVFVLIFDRPTEEAGTHGLYLAELAILRDEASAGETDQVSRQQCIELTRDICAYIRYVHVCI